MFYDLITKQQIDNIVEGLGVNVSSDTTPEQLLDIVKNIICEAINSIDKSAITEIVSDELSKTVRNMGLIR